MFPSVRRVVVASSGAAPPSAATTAAAVAAGVSSFNRRPLQPQPQQQQFSLQPQPQIQQQRRYSSSKPSSPDNGSKPLAGSSVPSSSSSSSSSSSNSSSSSSSSSQSAKRKRKAKETRPSIQKLPSVPSTQHLPIETLALSAFFSQHRPISITHSLPKVVSDDAFAAIFAPRAGGRGHKTSDVIHTLSRAVHDLESPMSGLSLNQGEQQQQQPQKVSRRHKEKDQEVAAARAQHARQQLQQQLEEDAQADEASAGGPKIEFKNADGSDSGIYVQLNALSGQFLPFQPPPPPVPEVLGAEGIETEAAAAEANANAMGKAATSSNVATAANGIEFAVADVDGAAAADLGDEPRSTRVFKAVLTIEEQVDEHGQVRIVAHPPQIVEEDGTEQNSNEASLAASEEIVPRSFFERMALRQLRFEDVLQRQRDGHHASAATQQLSASGSTPAPRMLAISVRRQRKLKMKKKKYKKLLKRTRNLRRKLDRT